jgi:hypothetical protein
MNTQILKRSIVILSSIFLIGSLALADGQDRGKSKTKPPGWEQGEKTGWDGKDAPPGLTEEKPEKKQKAKMKDDRDKGKAKNKNKRAKHEVELEEEAAEQEVEIEAEKKTREAEIKKEKKKVEKEARP